MAPDTIEIFLSGLGQLCHSGSWSCGGSHFDMLSDGERESASLEVDIIWNTNCTTGLGAGETTCPVDRSEPASAASVLLSPSAGYTFSHSYSLGGRSNAVSRNMSTSVPIPIDRSSLPPGRCRILNKAPHITIAAPIEYAEVEEPLAFFATDESADATAVCLYFSHFRCLVLEININGRYSVSGLWRSRSVCARIGNPM